MHRRLSKIFSDRRAVNDVLSNVILAGAVVALGLMAQIWAYQRSLAFNIEYANVVEYEIACMKEKLVIEHIFYNTSKKELTVYLLNCGKSNNVSLAGIYLSDGSWSQSYLDVELRFLNGTLTQNLDVGEEGYFKLSVELTPFYQIYTIRIMTERERLFVETFVP